MKMVKDTKLIKLPREAGSVASTLRRAAKKAKDQEWTKVIVIGQGRVKGGTCYSIMSDDTRYGLIVKSLVTGITTDYTQT